MAKTRMINTRFWNDSFISQLDPIEKLLFIYFITNEHTNICGIYELPLKIAAVETGIDVSMFEKIFPRLIEKVAYIEGWVCVKNFPKHQNADNPKVKKGIESELKAIPKDILQKSIAYGYPMQDSLHLDSDSDQYSDLDSDIQKNTLSKKDFEEFWKAYPKHTGKKKAKELWERLDIEDQQKALDDIPKRKEDDKWINGFYKDPERYIKHEQWNDDIIPPKVPKKVDKQEAIRVT